MAPRAGETIGRYQLISAIGSGGMGEVFKARDLELGRTVAIKFVRSDFADRFAREAKSIARLNHPNICTLYDVGPDYLVMEYVAGKTLAALIPASGMDLAKVREVGVQIARALHNAHAAGILHRDIKPANIIVSDAGGAKILDFGLARSTEVGRAASATSVTEVAGDTISQPGHFLGTVAYMSPEQAEGRPVDERSDVFSLGCVLYEMVTGRRAFSGDTPAAIMSAVLRDNPPHAAVVRPGVPPALERIVFRCLEKQPSRRYHSIADVALDLEQFDQESVPAVAPTRKKKWLPYAAAMLGGMGLASLYWVTRPAPAEVRIVPATTYLGAEHSPALSPDGNRLAFVWSGASADNWDIYVRDLEGALPLRLTSEPEAEESPAWSPDGKWIAFRRGDALYVVTPLGGPARRISTLPVAGAPSWTPDSEWILSMSVQAGGPLAFFPLSAGEPKLLQVGAPDELVLNPRISPDGSALAYISRRPGDSLYRQRIWIQPLSRIHAKAGARWRATEQDLAFLSLSWMAGGRTLLAAISADSVGIVPSLWRIPVNGRGAPVRIEAVGLNALHPATAPGSPRAVFTRHIADQDLWSWSADAAAQPFVALASTANEYGPSYSPDGKWLLFTSNRNGHSAEVWKARADGSQPLQLTRGMGSQQGSAAFSPDGKWIVFDSDLHGSFELFIMPADGGPPQRLTNHRGSNYSPVWSPDGKSVYFSTGRFGAPDIMRISVADRYEVRVTPAGGNWPRLSGDGNTLVFQRRGALWALSLSSAVETRIAPDVGTRAYGTVGDEVYYARASGSDFTHSLEVYNLRTRTARRLGSLPAPLTGGMHVAPDKKRVLFTHGSYTGSFQFGHRFGSDLMLIEGLQP